MIRIESLLRREIGLDAASIGSGLIQRTVRLRMKTHGHTTPEAYEHHLKNHPDELEELIESVVVTETWFYRDREPFHAFGQMALQVLSATPQAANCLRVLSVPCSTGEEPYSLAMTLLDAGASPDGYVIDAVDISARALARARTAVYGRNSFRGKDLAYRDRHFRPLLRSGAEGGANPNNRDYALNPRVRDRVQFHRANLLGEDFLSGHAPYDFIFCRNLLIYFDRATQQRALEKLHRLLTAAGTLFVGPAEMPLVAGNAFTN